MCILPCFTNMMRHSLNVATAVIWRHQRARCLSRSIATAIRLHDVQLQCVEHDAVADFYFHVLALRTRAQQGPARACLGENNATTLSCVKLRSDDPAEAAPQQETMPLYPFLTVACSNLKTASRHAIRMGGRVDRPVATGGTEATLVDPAGRGLRALHLFRRNPIISVTLATESMASSLRVFCDVLGMREVTRSDELMDVHLHPTHAASARVLTLGETHNTTAIVLVQAPEQRVAVPPAIDLAGPIPMFTTTDFASAQRALIMAGVLVDAQLDRVDASTQRTIQSILAVTADGHIIGLEQTST